MDESPAEKKWWISTKLKNCQKYCPKLAVYLPKDVTVQNPKLGLLNLCNSFLVLLFIFYYFFSNQNYIVVKVPQTTLAICGSRCLPTAVEQDVFVSNALTQNYCLNAANLNVNHANTTYSNAQCVGRCGTSVGSSSSCMIAQDYVQTEAEGVFFPTFYKEEYFMPANSLGACDPGLTPVYQGAGANQTVTQCTKKGNYWVAGADESKLVFNHEFIVKPHSTILDLFAQPMDTQSHSGSFASKGWDKSMVSILFDRNGNEQVVFNQSRPAEISLAELLRAAAYIDQTVPLTLDMEYENPIGSIDTPMPMRLTGADITVDLYTTDTGTCPVYDVYRSNVKKISVQSGRPVTCVTVFAERRWVEKEVNNPVGASGSRLRRVHGVNVVFRKMGAFTFTDDQVIFNNITVFFVWIKVPLQLTTFFCLFFLGKLSGIYSRVMNEEVNIAQACRGLMARLMHHSAAFMDLQDHDLGISKTRIHDRFKDFLLDNEDIDEDELNRFVDFVFEGLKGTGNHPNSDRDYVSLQEFCEVCASNEPLNFQALVQLFDNDRKLGILESFFTDKELKASKGMEAAESLKMVDYTKVPEDSMASHSRVESAVLDVEEMMKNLKLMEAKAVRTADTLEIGDEALGLNSGGTDSSTVEPKLDQRESFCSIPDEEDECAGGVED